MFNHNCRAVTANERAAQASGFGSSSGGRGYRWPRELHEKVEKTPADFHENPARASRVEDRERQRWTSASSRRGPPRESVFGRPRSRRPECGLTINRSGG